MTMDVTDRPPVLDVSDLRAGYGRKEVLHGISLTVGQGEVVCLLGHNGAGKSTTMRTIVGGVPARGGCIRFRGEDIKGRDVAERLRLGIAYVEPRGILPGLTVRDNLELVSRVLSTRRSKAGGYDRVLELFPDIRPRMRHYAGNLSGGQRQMLALSMALVGSPSVLMLDEPLLGLAPRVAQGLLSVISEIVAEYEAGLLIVEQNVRSALELSNRAYVLRAGELAPPVSSGELLKEKDFWSIL